MLYLDHAASSPVRREVLEAMWPWLTGEFGNPSSTHDLGRRAADGLADAALELLLQAQEGVREAGVAGGLGGRKGVGGCGNCAHGRDSSERIKP